MEFNSDFKGLNVYLTMSSGVLTLFIKIDLVHNWDTSFSFQKDMTVEGKGKGNMVPVNLVEPTRCDDALWWLSHRSDRQPKSM